MTRGEELVCEAARLWAPPRRITVSQWCNDNLYLSPEYSAFHGKFSAYAYQREPMDTWSDATVWQCVVKGAVQMLKTIVGQGMIGWAIDVDPGPILVVNEREEDADAYCRERIEPMVRDTPKLQGKVASLSQGKRRRKSTLREKWFPGGMLSSTFASVAGNLQRRAVKYLVCEEEDKWVASASGRGKPFLMALARMDTFGTLKKVFRSSSPSRPGSAIDEAYAASDQRQFFVRCWKCNHEQSMMERFFTNVQYDEELPTKEEQAASARYKCANKDCDVTWDDLQRWAAIDQGRWIAQAPFHGIAGFWISALYSPHKTLADLVLDYLSCKDNPMEKMTFINERLAENWIEKGEAPEWALIHKRCEPYRVGLVPRGGLFVTAGADVQHDRIECEWVAWGRNRESWSIDYRIFYGQTSDSEVWDRFWAAIRDSWPTAGGAMLPTARVFVDAGDQAHVVYGQVRMQPQMQVVAIKGAHRNAILPVSQPSAVDVTISGHKIKAGLRIRHVNGAWFKSELYADLKKEPGPGYCHFPIGQFYGEEHFKQLCAEQIVTRTDKWGRVRREWEVLRARNEALDCRVYARAAAYDLGMDRFAPHHWAQLEAQLQGELELTPVEPMPALPPLAPQARPMPAPANTAPRPVASSPPPVPAGMLRRPRLRVMGRISV